MRCHSLAIDGSKIYMIGGYVGRKSSNSIWKLDINPGLLFYLVLEPVFKNRGRDRFFISKTGLVFRQEFTGDEILTG